MPDARIAVVGIPGTLCDGRLFAPLFARLDVDASVAGFRGSTTVTEMAAAILETAAPVFVAVGFSLGGFVALELLRTAPSRLAGLVLIASHALPDGPLGVAERTRQAALLEESGSDALIDDLWPRYVGVKSASRADLRALIGTMAATFTFEDYARQSAMAASRSDSHVLLAARRVPTLVIAGEDDRLCPRDRLVQAAASAGTPLAVVAESGHFIPLEKPDELAGMIASWLATLPHAMTEDPPCC